MIKNRYAHDLARADDFSCEANVGERGERVSAWVVVGQEQACGVFEAGKTKDVSRVCEAAVHRPAK